MNKDTDKDIESSVQVEHRKLSRWALCSLIFGILNFLFSYYRQGPPFHALDIGLFVMAIIVILLLPAVICGYVAIYRINKNPQRYRGTWLALVGIAFACFVLLLSIYGSIIKPYLAINTFTSKLEHVTHIKVRSPEMFPGDIKAESVFFEEKDPKLISKIIQSIEIAPFGFPGRCACHGEVMIEFYKNSDLCVGLSFHHGYSLRWLDGWPSDVILTRKSASFLADWLAANNLTGPKERIEERRARQR